MTASVESFFERNPEEELQVVVALDVGQPRISPFGSSGGDGPSVRVSVPPKQDFLDAKNEVGDRLDAIGVKDVQWLDNARSFVAHINRDQAARLICDPLIAEITANERLRP